MNRRYEALKDFEAPGNGGVIRKGQLLELTPKLGAAWVHAGLVKEMKTDPVKAPAVKEVKSDGK